MYFACSQRIRVPNANGINIHVLDAVNIYKIIDYENQLLEVELSEDAQKIPYDSGWRVDKVILKSKRDIWTRDTFQFLADQGADLHRGWILNRAVRWSRTEVAEWLLEKGVNLDNQFDSMILFKEDVDSMAPYLSEEGKHEFLHCMILQGWELHNALALLGIKLNEDDFIWASKIDNSALLEQFESLK